MGFEKVLQSFLRESDKRKLWFPILFLCVLQFDGCKKTTLQYLAKVTQKLIITHLEEILPMLCGYIVA